MQFFTRKRTQQTKKNPQSKEDIVQTKENQLNLYQYQYILSIFSKNINKMTKNYKHCIGEIDQHPNYRVSRQVQQQSSNLQPNTYMKMVNKLLKDCLSRNTAIIKASSQYSLQYYNSFGNNQFGRTQVRQQIIPSIAQLKKMLLTEQQKHNKTLCNKDYRSKTVTTVTTQDKFTPSIQVFKNYQANLSSVLISKFVSQNDQKQCFARTTRSNISRNQRTRLKDLFLPQKKRKSLPLRKNQQLKSQIDSQCILINQRQHKEEPYIEALYEKLNCQKQILRSSTKMQNRRLTYNQQKAINDIQLFHQKSNKIEYVNFVWANPEAYSYRPKTKRWLRNFN